MNIIGNLRFHIFFTIHLINGLCSHTFIRTVQNKVSRIVVGHYKLFRFTVCLFSFIATINRNVAGFHFLSVFHHQERKSIKTFPIFREIGISFRVEIIRSSIGLIIIFLFENIRTKGKFLNLPTGWSKSSLVVCTLYFKIDSCHHMSELYLTVDYPVCTDRTTLVGLIIVSFFVRNYAATHQKFSVENRDAFLQ